MQLAFLLYKYFPYGGMQRDFRRFIEECQARGHQCRIYLNGVRVKYAWLSRLPYDGGMPLQLGGIPFGPHSLIGMLDDLVQHEGERVGSAA